MADKRAIFSFVQDENNKLWASVEAAPFKVKPVIKKLLLDPPAGDLTSQQDIANHGDEIRKALMAHPEIGSVLGALDRAPNGESWNLMFNISSPVGEAMRWEVLRNSGPDYLVLSAARRLFRVAADPSSPELGIRTFPNPLRFVAFLSPSRTDSTDEFNELVAAADAGRKAGLPLELMLYVGQRELVPSAPPWATCKLMPSKTEELQEELKLQQPHILHFFCHGQSELPQALQFATVAEQRAGAPVGSILLSMDRIVEGHLLDPTWIVVFNCCDGGRPGEALASMAYRAVAESGVPAAIGMGSPLPAGAAPLFSAALYRKLFAMLAATLPAIQTSAQEIDFGEAIAAARVSLHGAIAAAGLAFSCWSLPIIYLNRKPFIIQKALGIVTPPPAGAGSAPAPVPAPAPPDSAIAERIATIAGMLQAMPSTTPRAVRQQMVALFDQDPYVPPALRCDENGTFPIADRGNAAGHARRDTPGSPTEDDRSVRPGPPGVASVEGRRERKLSDFGRDQVMNDVRVNAWTGSAPLTGPAIDSESPWGLSVRTYLPRPSPKLLLPAAPPDDRDWTHPKVGWGIVMPDDDAVSDAAKASGEDALPPIRKLRAARNGAPILRYRAGSINGYLRRYFTDGRGPSDLDVSASRTGLDDDEIPKYLLICGGPRQIPWRTQYALNMSRCVGRIHLEGDALERYVDHLIGVWPDVVCNPLAPVVWSVNFGEADITCLMQQVVADRFWKSIAADADFAKAIRLADGAATGAALAGAMSAHPGLVITTSHGMTGPEQKPGSIPDELGLPVDANHALLSSAVLPDAAIPGGAIWYAHACCSAGSDANSQCAELFPLGHTIGDTLRSVSANAGSCVAPLAGRLLGADKPLRAFIGHVEPTFDWMLRDPNTNQAVGDVLADALYSRLYQKGTPVGLALSAVYSQSGSFLTLWKQAIDAVNKDKPGAAELARYWQVAALDRQSMVLLGDPTVTLPLK